ncbi:MAG TPA: aldo/keto reductase [bacterium]|nr:aldo/keto reductase [bacterium]
MAVITQIKEIGTTGYNMEYYGGVLMEYRELGTTGLEVSILGYGASPLGAEFGRIDPAEGERAVHYAIDHGINYFDVSPYYGRTLAEERLGQFLKGKRDDIILATKCGRYGKELPDGFDFSAQRIQQSVEESLSRLRIEYFDVFQVHDVEFGDPDQIIGETIPAMKALREQGKIGFIGVTGYPLQILKNIAAEASVDTILTYSHYNLMNTTMDDVLTDFAREDSIGLINASPLHMRLLTQKGAPDWHPAPAEVKQKAREAAHWCESQGVDIADLAMQFALNHSQAATTLVGMSKVRHVEKNLEAVGTQPDAEILEKVLDIFEPVKDINWMSGLPENNDPGSVPTGEV